MLKSAFMIGGLAILSLAQFSTSASAVNVKNCTKSNLKILVFNQNDKVEGIHKAKILVAKNGGYTSGISIPGKNYHKFKVFARGILDNHLGTFRGVDENKTYSVVGAGSGRIKLKNGGNC